MPWRIALGGALYALAEIGLALTLGHFLDWGRAEALIFFAFRPWCLLGLALAAHRRSWAFRWGLYGAGLLLASLAEGVLLTALGAPDPMPELARGLLGGAALLVLYEALIQGGRRLHPKAGLIAGAVLALPFLLPDRLGIYDALILEKPGQQLGEKPRLMLLSALPLQWGSPSLEPVHTETYQQLAEEFDIAPIDTVDEGTLDAGRLLLIAQPRRLAPIELVRIDAWVRRGGRALILTDPLLVWPSDMPIGDARRAPPVGLLSPLLAHWGVTLAEAPDKGVAMRMSGGRKWAVAAPGRLKTMGPACTVSEEGLIADCRIGAGKVRIVGDVDMLHDGLWTAPGENGAARQRRIADNPLIVADWLDALAGVKRPRLAGDVAWRAPGADGGRAVLLALIPVLLAALLAFLLRLPRKS